MGDRPKPLFQGHAKHTGRKRLENCPEIVRDHRCDQWSYLALTYLYVDKFSCSIHQRNSSECNRTKHHCFGYLTERSCAFSLGYDGKTTKQSHLQRIVA